MTKDNMWEKTIIQINTKNNMYTSKDFSKYSALWEII